MPKAPTDANSILMQECGAKAPFEWQPEPTDHIQYQMNRGDAIAQVVGWVKWHTIRGVRRGGKIQRSAWAIDDKGKLLTIKHAALDLGWTLQTAINNFRAAEQEGLIRIEKGDGRKDPGRIGLAADVPSAGRRKGKLHNSVQSSLPPYLIEKIQGLGEVNRQLFLSSYAAFEAWRKEAMGDVVAEARAYIEQVEDTTLQAFGLEKKREVKRRVKKTGVSVALPELPDFVHCVQSADAEDCTKPKTGFVRNRDVLQGKVLAEKRAVEAESITTDTTATATSPRNTPQPQQAFNLSAYPLTDSAITGKFPACSLEYRWRIVQAALALGDPRTNDRIIAEAVKAASVDGQRSAALYIKTVPEALGAWLRDADRRKTA